MRSFLYRAAEAVTARLSHKKIFGLRAPELKEYLEKARERRHTAPPGFIQKRHNLEQIAVEGRPCYVITPRNGGMRDKAVLFIHGGGFIMEAHPVHWRAVSLLISRLGVPVWFPAYPLFPDHSIPEAVTMITAVYAAMLEKYPPQGITVQGDSAGGALALILCHHNAKQALPLAMPGKLILVSPAMLTEQDEGILEAMRRIEPHDVMLSMTFMYSLAELYNLDMSRDNYYNAPLYGDFSGFPKMYIFAGTFDCVYPQSEAFAKRLAASGIEAEFCRGEEMMHVWPYIPLARECREALEKIFDITKNKNGGKNDKEGKTGSQ